MEAAMKIAEASNSFSPCRLLNRPLARIHISRGMLKIRISVMELGRFTRLGGSGGQPESSFDYAPRKEGTQWKGDLLQRRSSLRLCRVQQPSGGRDVASNVSTEEITSAPAPLLPLWVAWR